MKLKMTEIARALDLPPDTVNRWIRQGRIPIQKKGAEGVFKDAVLRQWALKHQLHFSPNRDPVDPQPDMGLGTLTSAMRAGRVFYGIKGDATVSVLESAVRVIPGLPGEARRELYRRLVDRESLTSTGIGKGVAIPHPRSPMTEKTKSAVITTCFLDHPVDFDAIDSKPVLTNSSQYSIVTVLKFPLVESA